MNFRRVAKNLLCHMWEALLANFSGSPFGMVDLSIFIEGLAAFP